MSSPVEEMAVTEVDTDMKDPEIAQEGDDEPEPAPDKKEKSAAPREPKTPPSTSKSGRERKTVARFEQSGSSQRQVKTMAEGTGTKLGDCPVINHLIGTGPQDDVRALHQVIFARPGRTDEYKKNLRNFRGFPYGPDSPEFVKKRENLERYILNALRSMSNILDLEKKPKSTREELALAVVTFLCNPQPSGREVKGHKKKSHKKINTAKKAKSSDGAEDGAGDEAGAGEAKKKPKKSPTKKPGDKKTPKKAGEKKPKSGEKKAAPKKRKRPEVDAGAADDSSDDEPLVKVAKTNKPPTDNELRSLVRQLLDGADLQQVTMKSVLTSVYDRYPLHDLTKRKDFIKATVKTLIS